MSEEINNQGAEWITFKEAAQILNCSTRTIRRRMDAGKIETRIEYQGKQSIRYVRRGDILREAGIIQVNHPPAEVVTRGGSHRTEEIEGQNLKVVTGLIWKAVLILSVIIILGGVTAYYFVIGQGQQTETEIKAARAEISGIMSEVSQVKQDYVTGNQATREALKADIEAIRADTRAEDQTTGAKIENQAAEIRQTGDRVKIQAEKIDKQTTEIEALKKEVSNQNAAIISLMDSIRELIEHKEKPEAPPAATPIPAATIIPIIQPIQTPEPESGFLGIF